MGDMLSQAEIDALLSSDSNTEESFESSNIVPLNDQEIDALGEIGNISMGASATALFTLLSQRVSITAPEVTIVTLDDIKKEYESNYIGVNVQYKEGFLGSNILILKEADVKVITDLMMGGEGAAADGAITDLHLSAIGEAMNQMIGSSCTSMSSMFNKRIDISPPKAFNLNFEEQNTSFQIEEDGPLAKISFKLIIGDLLNSEIMQLIPVSFAKKMVEGLLHAAESQQIETPQPAPQPSQPQPVQQMETQHNSPPQPQNMQGYGGMQPPQQFGGNANTQQNFANVNVQPAYFQSFDEGKMVFEKENIGVIMDVPLQITVELGRTTKLIRDILEFGSGSIIELDKLAGEPVDILVNGKNIAKGEVVVIDESFGVRITDIIHPSKRL